MPSERALPPMTRTHSAKRRRAATLLALTVATALPAVALHVRPTHAEQAAATQAYADVAAWLFELYLDRSLTLTIASAARQRPGAEQVLVSRSEAITGVMQRHRDGFIAAMQQPLRSELPEVVIADLHRRILKQPADLDDASRARLIAVDSHFRRDAQAVILAMTNDLTLMISDALASGGAPKPAPQ
jgi:hypothetical protein